MSTYRKSILFSVHAGQMYMGTLQVIQGEQCNTHVFYHYGRLTAMPTITKGLNPTIARYRQLKLTKM